MLKNPHWKRVRRRNVMAEVIPKVMRAIETKLIHAGEPEPLIGGAVAMPIFQSATFAYRGEQNYHDLRYQVEQHAQSRGAASQVGGARERRGSAGGGKRD